MYLILSTPSIEYAEAISRELWRLVRPAGNETSQFYTGRYAHPDGTKVAIGPVDGTHPIHKDADEFTLASLIAPAITDEEEEAFIQTIAEAKGGSLDVLAMLQGIESLSQNLRTREQLEAEGWFTTDEV
jgi:hypothetical protein